MSGRRAFLMQGSAGLLALQQLPSLLDAQSGKARGLAPDVLDFWVNRVGVPPNLILGDGEGARGSSGELDMKNVKFEAGYGSEPLFLHVDEAEGRLLPAEEIPADKLLPDGDALIELKMGRMRLNSQDQVRFDKFNTTGIYLDVEQQRPPAESFSSLGWSMIGAMFSKTPPKPGVPPNQVPALAGDSTKLQSIGLPKGAGKTMFACFMKDQKKSAFGTLISALVGLDSNGSPASFVPMLQLPGIIGPALSGIRALVGKLQASGGDHYWLFQNSPIPVAATAGAMSQGSLNLRSGYYIVLSKSHGSAFKGQLDKLKILDGFLVPREATMLDVYDAAPTTVREASYLSLHLTVRKTQLSACPVGPAPAKS
jgi:hypothetical protein